MRLTTLFFFAILLAAPGRAAVTVTQASGRIYYLKTGTTVWTQAAVGSVISPGDRVRADSGSKATVDFGDGSRIEIGANASFTLQGSGPEKTEVLFSIGRLRAWVSKRLGQNFRVRTPTAVCSVRGTEFAVEVNPAGNTRVEMFEGVLAVGDNRGSEVLLRDGQQLDVTGKGLGTVEGQGAAPSGADARREAAKREVGLDMSKEEVQSAAALEQKSAVYQQGKAIIDVNGHRVRIEEYIVRSRPDEFKLVVLNSRVDRFDYFYYRGTFNKALPDDLSVALRQLPGCVGSACEYFLTAYDTGRSNTKDTMQEVSSGGHLVDVNNNGVAGDRVEAAFDSASDQFIDVNVGAPGTDTTVATGDATLRNTPFFKTLYNTNILTFNGVQHGGWTLAGGAPVWTPPGMTAAAAYAKNTTTHLTDFAGAAATTLKYEPACGPPDCTYTEAGVMHQVFYAESADGKTWEKYDNYIISDEGKVAKWTDFANITTGRQYKETLLNWNYQTIVTASEFQGRKIDLAVEPKIFIQSGLIQ